MSKTVEVRIRADFQPKSVRFTDWPIEDLAAVIRHIESWGLIADGDERSALTGQFVLADGEAYFEIVVIAEDDE